MNNGLSPASLVARSAAIMGALAQRTNPPLTGVGINLWTWKANGFLAPFRR